MNWKMRLGVVLTIIWLFVAYVLVAQDVDRYNPFRVTEFLILVSPPGWVWGIFWVWAGYKSGRQKNP